LLHPLAVLSCKVLISNKNRRVLSTSMKWLLGILVLLTLHLQFRLWFGEGSYAHLAQLQQDTLKQDAENARLRERNRLLAVEVSELKSNDQALEARARNDLGMIKEGETFFMVLQPDTQTRPL
jgi:cell division protein FtsB